MELVIQRIFNRPFSFLTIYHTNEHVKAYAKLESILERAYVIICATLEMSGADFDNPEVAANPSAFGHRYGKHIAMRPLSIC